MTHTALTPAPTGGHLLGYARVSTAEQDVRRRRLQQDVLTAAGCYRTFTDTASGVDPARTELTAVLDQLRPGDTLVVWRLDRLGRSVQDLIALVVDLRARDVGFRFLTEGIDTTTPGGRFVLVVLAGLAEMERELIRERTIAGLAAAPARGRRGGRPVRMSPAKLRVARGMREADPRHLAVAGAGRPGTGAGVSGGALVVHLVQRRWGVPGGPDRPRRSRPHRD